MKEFTINDEFNKSDKTNNCNSKKTPLLDIQYGRQPMVNRNTESSGTQYS